MRALSELRDPVAVALASATALAALWLGHDLVGISAAVLVVLLARVGAGLVLRRRAEPSASEREAAVLPSGSWFEPLTRREAEVALLIRDSTNKEIADRLFLSERTIDNHVANIMNKLNLHHRAQIAAWVAERNSSSGSIVADVEIPIPRRLRDTRSLPPKP